MAKGTVVSSHDRQAACHSREAHGVCHHVWKGHNKRFLCRLSHLHVLFLRAGVQLGWSTYLYEPPLHLAVAPQQSTEVMLAWAPYIRSVMDHSYMQILITHVCETALSLCMCVGWSERPKANVGIQAERCYPEICAATISPSPIPKQRFLPLHWAGDGPHATKAPSFGGCRRRRRQACLWEGHYDAPSWY